MYAAQRVWLDWIAERFAEGAGGMGGEGGAGAEDEASCGIQETYTPARPLEAYQAETNYFLEFATQGYQVA